MEIKRSAVIGSGLMGHGIAEVFALSGLNVVLNDVSQEFLDRAKENILGSLTKMKNGNKITEEKLKLTLDKIFYTTDLKQAVSDADIILEAVPEILDLKKKVLSDVANSCRPDAIIASNTSNFKITTLQEDISHPERVAGMHFFNPPVVLKLVEVVKGERTSQQIFDSVYDLTKKIGKVPIRVMKDSPGFVVNRINAPESLLFCLLLDKGIDNPDAIDRFARSQGLPMGPYELMDYVGIDTVVHSMEYYSKELSPDYAKCSAYRNLMEKNHLGRKTGHGFYLWQDGRAQIPAGDVSSKVELMDVLAVELNEAVKLLEEGVATPEDIETGVREGMNRPFGPISVAQGLTNSEILSKLTDLSKKFETTVFEPANSIKEGKLKEIISGKMKREDHRETQKETQKPSGQAASEDPVIVERKGKVARVILNNGRLNLLNQNLMRSLDAKLQELSEDREIYVIIVTGQGEVFSAGAELSQFFSGGIDFMDGSRYGQSVFRRLSEMRKITIAEIKGYALGGGFELSLACDIRFSTPEAKIGFPEVQRGLLPGWGGTQRLPRLIGMSRASYLILSAERINGNEAKEIGIVSRLYPPEGIDDETIRFAVELSRKVAPGAAYLAKTLISRGMDSSLDDGFAMESISMGLIFGTEDLKEGISAFMQKRDPEFKGK